MLEAGALTFLDSGGLHALIVLTHVAAARNARIYLADPTSGIRGLLRRTGADRVIDVIDSA